eukprot:scaffold11667_cov328-Ochromonas_danica.AAC.4
MALYGDLDLVAEMLTQHSQCRQGSLTQEFSSLVQILRSHPFVLYRDPTLTWDVSTLATDLAVWKDRFRDLSVQWSRSILLAVPQLDGLFRLLAGERLALDRMTAHDLHAKICSHLLYASANASALLVSRGNIVTLLKQCLGEGSGTTGNEGSYMVSALLEMLSTGGAITSVWQQLLQLRQDVKSTCGLALDGLLTQALAHLALLLRFEVPELQIVLPGRDVNAVDGALQDCMQALLEMEIPLELPLGYLSFMSEGVASSQTISSLAKHFLSTSHYLGDEEVMEVLSFLKNNGAEEEYRSLAQQRAESWLSRGPLAPLLTLSSISNNSNNNNNSSSSSAPPPPLSVISKALQYLICAGNTSMVVQVTDGLLFLVMLSVRRFLQGDLQFYPGPPLPMAVSRTEQANRLADCMRLLRIEETTMNGQQELEEVLLQSVEALQLLRDDDLLVAALPEEEDMALRDMIEALRVYVDAVRSLFQHVQDGPAAQAKAFREAAHLLLGLMRPNSTPRFNVRYHLHVMEMVAYLHRRHAETVVKEQSPSAIFLKNAGKPVLSNTASHSHNTLLRLSVASADEVRQLMLAIGEIETFSGFGDLLVLCGWRESSEGDEDGLAALKRQFLGMLTVATLEEAHLRYRPEVIRLDKEDVETTKDLKGVNWMEEAKGFESSYLY